jgi:hypothetical protein
MVFMGNVISRRRPGDIYKSLISCGENPAIVPDPRAMELTDEITAICSKHGLATRRVELHGDVAVIVPAELDSPVSPEKLAGIAEAVRQFGIKHVALDIDPEEVKSP